MKYTGPSKRKLSGGIRKLGNGKKQRFLARPPTETRIGDEKKKTIRIMGGNRKIRLLRVNKVNILDPATKKVARTEVVGLDTNPASRDYSRRKVITKGAIIETKLGKARVTNKPGSDSVLNAVLLQE